MGSMSPLGVFEELREEASRFDSDTELDELDNSPIPNTDIFTAFLASFIEYLENDLGAVRLALTDKNMQMPVLSLSSSSRIPVVSTLICVSRGALLVI